MTVKVKNFKGSFQCSFLPPMNVWFCAGWKQLVRKKKSPHLLSVWPDRQLWNLGICKNKDGKGLEDQIKESELSILKIRNYFFSTFRHNFHFLVYPIIPPPMCHVGKVVFFKLKWTNIHWVLEIETLLMLSWAKPHSLGVLKLELGMHTYKTSMLCYIYMIINI